MELCEMCVILSAKNHILVDKTLVDKESILANLNLKGMAGDDVEDKIKSIGSMNILYTLHLGDGQLGGPQS